MNTNHIENRATLPILIFTMGVYNKITYCSKTNLNEKLYRQIKDTNLKFYMVFMWDELHDMHLFT